jgi:demethylmenaquinone methyltransferase/2-methoxy-6-polyprenyl-1,4-benzoquinol methylase
MKSNYDLFSRIYDPFLYLPLRSIRRSVLEELLDHKDKAILDLCCGTGNQMKLLSKNGFKDLHCLDISKSMLTIAKMDSNDLINIYNEDATRTNFDSGSFDIVIISLAIHEKDFVSQMGVLNEAHRLIRGDGYLLIVDFDFDDRTNILIKMGIFIVEMIAGREHYTNFKHFLKNSGVSGLVDQEKFVLVKRNRNLFDSISISIYNKAQ